MVCKARNVIWRPAGISRIVLVYKLPLQSESVTFGLGLGLHFKTKIFGLGLEAQVLGLGGLAARGLGLNLPPQGLDWDVASCLIMSLSRRSYSL